MIDGSSAGSFDSISIAKTWQIFHQQPNEKNHFPALKREAIFVSVLLLWRRALTIGR